MMDPGAARGPGSRFSPFRMRNLQMFAGRRSPGREIPHAPQTRSPRLPKHGKRSGRGATGVSGDRMEGKGGVRMRSSAAPGAYAHAGHASRTLFANATAAIFLRSLSTAAIFLRRICYCRICLCRYYVGHNAIAAIFYVDILYCSYTHITYS